MKTKKFTYYIQIIMLSITFSGLSIWVQFSEIFLFLE